MPARFRVQTRDLLLSGSMPNRPPFIAEKSSQQKYFLYIFTRTYVYGYYPVSVKMKEKPSLVKNYFCNTNI